MTLLAPDFFARDAVEVAPRLLGCVLRHGQVAMRITEVEAYMPGDSACHASRGQTTRNAAMFGRGGHAYVFLCYGLHQMLNLVTNAVGEGAAVLIRSAEPVEGLAVIRDRRGGKQGPVLLTGPGKIGQALALDRTWCGHDICTPGGLEVHSGPPPNRIVTGPRVGIDYAKPHDVAVPWRFADADSEWVSHRRRFPARG